MFDRFIRLAKARKALRDLRFEDALQLAADPLIQTDRRAEQVRAAARGQLLARARQRLAAGDPGAARYDLQQLQKAGTSAEVDSLAAGIESATAAAQAATDLVRRNLDEARRLLAAGDTAGTGAVLASIGTSHLMVERQQLLQLVAERRRLAGEQLVHVGRQLQAGQIEAAMEGFARAVALARDVADDSDVRSQVLRAALDSAHRRIELRLAEADLEGALAAYRETLLALPHLGGSEGLRGVEQRLRTALLEALRATVTWVAALPLARAARASGLEPGEPLAALVDGVLRAEALSADDVGLAAELRDAAQRAGATGLAADASRRLERGHSHENQLAEARARLASGEFDGARALLTQVLLEQPLHEAARRDLDLVDQGMADLDQRLAAARVAASGGRLREACAVAMALVGAGRVGTTAQLLVGEVRARMAVVDRGLDEVRVALHGRAAASTEGVRHSLRRLEELAKVQLDHTELPKVTAAVKAEIEALEACERIAAALEQQPVAEVCKQLDSLLAMRVQFLVPDRLDARLFQLLDRVGQQGALALAGGRLADAEVCAALFGRFATVRAEFGVQQDKLRLACAERKQAAEGLVEAAKAQLARGDLAEAERLCEQAQLQWSESVSVRSLAEQLRSLRQQSDALVRVESMTKERDFHGAQQKLAELPPTPALLRTRIYDMKQNLARAQGLEGGFLLRIDEGGEHLVRRGESVSIGNVRQTRSDLPVLASVAGRHATFQRSMSFHGGMQDTVVAEEGEVRVGGKLVTKHRLAPGDRVQLGPALTLLYQQPCSRSLSVALVLQGGFQVGGTDRVLLMKDRGRDGRLLIGPGRDVHARVPGATGEVEVFATSTGQIRVASDSGGTIDGVAFRGDHPVAAGQLVEAAGVTFVLLSWHSGA